MTRIRKPKHLKPVIPRVSFARIVQFIIAQPDDREINNSEHFSNDRTGNLMVQFGRDTLRIDRTFACNGRCYFDTQYAEQCYAKLDLPVMTLLHWFEKYNVSNYKEAKIQAELFLRACADPLNVYHYGTVVNGGNANNPDQQW